MPVVNVEDLVRLHRKPEDIRNICILAHVDHGKTSLTDSLIATNGIISPKLAGKIRYLDSRPDEQLRGITMESSAISLFFSMLRRPNPEAAPVPKEYLINLIDSPGHIDFSSEVSTASRLCDGAIVLVDAVEGVCSQTVTVLRQSWVEQLKPILVINKMDRLVSELQMSPSEAYAHLSRLLEQVNAVIGSFYQGERMEEDLQWRERMEDRINASAAEKSKKQSQGDASSTADSGIDAAEFEEIDDEDLYFAPEKNNVIFCSAVDGWAFTIRQFAAIYERKIGIKRSVLEKVLWGDFYLDPKTKRVLGQKHLKGRSLKPMFVQLVLDSVWAAYEATTGGGKGKGDPALLEKITKSLNISIPPYILRSRDPKNIMTTLFSMWLPLSTAVLVSVIEYLPSPPSAQATRLPDMIEGSPGANFVDSKVKDAMSGFKTGKEEPVVAYVSKMVAIPESELTSSKKRSGTTMTADEAREIARRKREEIAKMQEAANGGSSSGQEKDDYARITSSFDLVTIDDNADQQPENAEDKADPEHLIGFARLYSGTLSVGDTVYVLGPKFTPANPHAKPEPHRVTITDLYLLMGKSLEPLQSVPAGVVFGIGGLAGHVLKNGTLCSQLSGSVNLAGVSLATPPIVRVSLEPANPADLSKMVTGLRLLEQSDPCAQYEVLPNGEHVMLTAGELHLERCLKDLRERFARCDIQTGQTIVPYRETTVTAPEMAPPKNPDLGRGAVQLVSSSKQLTVRLRVVPLPAPVTEFFTKQVGTIKQLQLEKHSVKPDEEKEEEEESETGDVSHEAQESTGSVLSLEAFRTELTRIFDEEVPDKEVWKNVVDQITAFGPRRIGPNILVDATAVNTCEKFLINDPKQQPSIPSQAEGGNRQALIVRDFCDKIAYAFQLATAQGPLCQEPIQGTAVFLEELAANDDAGELDLGRLTGEAIKLVRESISQGFLDWSPRIMLAMYSCEIQASTEVLGRVYGVITRRRGRILSEAMKEGTPFFTILSLLPVAESFGFAEEIRKRTSGAAQPQLIFAGFEALDEDPFWVPATEEELEDLGELADRENLAKRYMDAVRARKGLVVQGRKLIDAEKQKTLKK